MRDHPGTGLDSEFDDADRSPGLVLWQVTNRWQAAQRAALAPLDLTHVQFVLLAALTWLEARTEVVTQRDIADYAATDPMMTSQVLRALESKGLVERIGHPSDGRAKAVTATSAGVVLVNRAIKVVEECDATFFGVLGSEGPQLVDALLRLRDRR